MRAPDELTYLLNDHDTSRPCQVGVVEHTYVLCNSPRRGLQRAPEILHLRVSVDLR